MLDNLLTDGKIVPMIVVMPYGSVPVKTFAEDLGNSIIPYTVIFLIWKVILELEGCVSSGHCLTFYE
ncbi:hypothetical protein L0657_26895 [Dyadobacter sp. CY345]|uniref:hypothetical protein n=1 Tax=Dyadobacter sp. CY345 TaxID=2909335 RepID=UPI001F2D0724|nr:hypothetical protein [Dyadobacter sp. CY345]MCF2447612.1 hypothetical protein [Dyadobacter sp. CY345]